MKKIGSHLRSFEIEKTQGYKGELINVTAIDFGFWVLCKKCVIIEQKPNSTTVKLFTNDPKEHLMRGSKKIKK